MSPETSKLLAAVLQSAIGALSALVAVYLTQRHANKVRRDSLFDRLFDHYFDAYSDVYQKLLDLRHAALVSDGVDDARDRFTASIKSHSLFLNEDVIVASRDILQKLNDGSDVDADIQSLCRHLQSRTGVSELFTTIKKGKS